MTWGLVQFLKSMENLEIPMNPLATSNETKGVQRPFVEKNEL